MLHLSGRGRTVCISAVEQDVVRKSCFADLLKAVRKTALTRIDLQPYSLSDSASPPTIVESPLEHSSVHGGLHCFATWLLIFERGECSSFTRNPRCRGLLLPSTFNAFKIRPYHRPSPPTHIYSDIMPPKKAEKGPKPVVKKEAVDKVIRRHVWSFQLLR